MHSALQDHAVAVKLLLKSGAIVGDGAAAGEADKGFPDAVVVAHNLRLYQVESLLAGHVNLVEVVHVPDEEQYAAKAAEAAAAAAIAAASSSAALKSIKTSAIQASAAASASDDESFMRAVILRAFDYVQVTSTLAPNLC